MRDFADTAIIIYEANGQACRLRTKADASEARFEGPTLISAVNEAIRALRHETDAVIFLPSDISENDIPGSDWLKVADADPMIGMVVAAPETAELISGAHRYLVLGRSDAALLRNSVLKDFGPLHEKFRTVRFALDDLLLRANRCGYRCAGRVSRRTFESRTSHTDWRLLLRRHPDVFSWLRRELRATSRTLPSSTPPAAQNMTTYKGLRSVGFDLTNLRRHHDGTSELAKKVCSAFLAAYSGRVDVRFWGDASVLAFHDLPDPSESSDAPDVAFRIGQFQHPSEIVNFIRRAPVVGAFFLDTIAMDCLYLDGPDFSTLWADGFEGLDFVIFNSEFTGRQARLRFPGRIPPVAASVLHSTDTAEYRSPSDVEAGSPQHILVVGNRFAHKDLIPTVTRLAASTSRPIKALGIAARPIGSAEFIPSGSLPDDRVAALFRDASVVVFPSHYEGFGFPIMHAMAARSPVVCRDLPVFREIREALPEARNVHLCTSTENLIERALDPGTVWNATPCGARPVSWKATAEEILRSAEAAMQQCKSAEQKTKLIGDMQLRHAGLRYGRRVARLLRSFEKRVDRMVAPAASLLGMI